MVDRHDIAWHEKTLGQLFCDETAKDIIKMLIAESPEMDLRLRTSLVSLDQTENGFRAVIETGGKQDTLNVANVVVACGGKSIPKMGATDLGYKIAQKFGHQIIETRPALVPLTFSGNPFASMSGTAAPVRLTANDTSFDEALLFTHRGLSGPAVLQVSSYWTEGDSITVDLASNGTLPQTIKTARSTEGRKDLTTILAQHLPTKLVAHLSTLLDLSGNVGDLSDKKIDALVDDLRNWSLTPNGSEGYRTAEVTLGGVDTDGLSSKTMISKNTPGLYFIGEVVDVTGWLGGYNFQWAWSSGWAAGQDIAGN
jgi:predicted Rossmann fold flavoprotein